jgi:hypothetical protein
MLRSMWWHQISVGYILNQQCVSVTNKRDVQTHDTQFYKFVFVINIKADNTSGDPQSLKSAMSHAVCTFYISLSSLLLYQHFIDADHASPLLFVSKWNKREQHWSNLQYRSFWKQAISVIRSLYIITASVRYDAVSIYRKVFEKLV